MKEHDPLETALDRALASYIPTEPRPGLEHRLLARLAAADQASPRRRWTGIWPAAAGLAAAVLLGALIWPHAHRSVSIQAGIERTPPTPKAHFAPRPAETAFPGRSGERAAIRLASRTPATRRTGFQLTRHQRWMAQTAAQWPDAMAALARADDEQQRPLEVQPIPDTPLTIDPLVTAPNEDNSADPATQSGETGSTTTGSTTTR